METARIIQKEGVSFNPDNLCSVELASKDGLSSDHAISLGLLGADLSYASIYRKNSIALSYLEAVKTLSQELGVGSVSTTITALPYGPIRMVKNTSIYKLLQHSNSRLKLKYPQMKAHLFMKGVCL